MPLSLLFNNCIYCFSDFHIAKWPVIIANPNPNSFILLICKWGFYKVWSVWFLIHASSFLIKRKWLLITLIFCLDHLCGFCQTSSVQTITFGFSQVCCSLADQRAVLHVFRKEHMGFRGICIGLAVAEVVFFFFFLVYFKPASN